MIKHQGYLRHRQRLVLLHLNPRSQPVPAERAAERVPSSPELLVVSDSFQHVDDIDDPIQTMDLTQGSPPPPPPLVSVHERRMSQLLTASQLPSNLIPYSTTRSSRGVARKKPKKVMEAERDLESQEGHKAKAKAAKKAAKEAATMRRRNGMIKPEKEDFCQLADPLLHSSLDEEHKGRM